LKSDDGSIYTGNFTWGYPDGRGKKIYIDGSIISGIWSRGRLETTLFIRKKRNPKPKVIAKSKTKPPAPKGDPKSSLTELKELTKIKELGDADLITKEKEAEKR
jgi:hypothetical protein